MSVRPLRVWLVDDDASIRWVLERALKGGGMLPRVFESAEPALEALRTDAPDVLLTDIRMPGQSGLDLLRRIHGTRPRTVDAPQQVQTRLPRHPDVGEQHIGRIGAQRFERRLGGLEDPRQHAAAFQGTLEHPTYRGVVIDQPDTQRADAHDAVSATDGAAPNGRSTLNSVRPGSLSNPMLPPLRVTISCATARPSPVPFARPVTSG